MTATATVQHTPGPWEVDGVGVYEVANREMVTRIDEASGETREHRCGLIALVYERYGADDQTHGGNAYVVAAAPELYSALRALLLDIESGLLVRDVTRDGDPNWSREMLDFVMRLQRAQAAIAKAEGGR